VVASRGRVSPRARPGRHQDPVAVNRGAWLLPRPIQEAPEEPARSNRPATRRPNCATTGGLCFRLLNRRRIRDRPLQLMFSTDPIALNVRPESETSADQDAPLCRRCSADWTLEIERGVMPGHFSLLPLLGRTMMSLTEHSSGWRGCSATLLCLRGLSRGIRFERAKAMPIPPWPFSSDLAVGCGRALPSKLFATRLRRLFGHRGQWVCHLYVAIRPLCHASRIRYHGGDLCF